MKVLIAVEDPATGADTIERSYDLFGPEADYTAVCVGEVGSFAYPVTPLGIQPALMWVLPGDTPIETATAVAERAVDAAEPVSEDDVTVISDAGPPGPVICRLAETTGADVVVVGSHERGWLTRLLTPSVGHHVVDHAPCHVLVIRSAEAAADES